MVTEAPTFGRYVLGPRIARGGMGEVFLATQTGMGAFAKPLVLKLMLPHLARRQSAIDLFLAEARLASRMNHPNVVQIFDVGVIDERYFIAMELVRGVSLSRLLLALRQGGQTLPVDMLLYVAHCLCDGLHHAHEQRGADGKPLNLVHQDVTLENVLVSTDGQVKLTDFGIARATRAPDASLGAGKAGYIAPEAIDGAVDRRADIYGSAVTLLSLAALERPHERGGEPRPTHTSTPLPPAIADTLLRACAETPTERFESARRFRDALPPPESPDVAEALGALVQRVCAQQVTQLDGDVHRTTAFSRQGGTDALATATAASENKAKPKSRRAWLIGAVAALAGVALWWLPLPAGERVGVRGQTEAPAPPPPPPMPEPPKVEAPVPTQEVVEAPPRPTITRKRPVKTPPRAETGTLTIDAKPWAMVSINGKAIGETPIGRYTVPAGRVVIDFINPESGAKSRRTVTVAPGASLAVTETLK